MGRWHGYTLLLTTKVYRTLGIESKCTRCKKIYFSGSVLSHRFLFFNFIMTLYYKMRHTLLQNATAILLQNVTKAFEKMWQVFYCNLKYDNFIAKYNNFIMKWESYFKLCQWKLKWLYVVSTYFMPIAVKWVNVLHTVVS